MTTARRRVLSGMQPSGLMHLGNYLGALKNWKALQEQYDCYFFVADWHALSTNYADTSRIRTFVHEMLIDWLAGGIDPERSTIFIQSRIPEHAILHLLLSMWLPLLARAQPDLQRKTRRDQRKGSHNLRLSRLPGPSRPPTSSCRSRIMFL